MSYEVVPSYECLPETELREYEPFRYQERAIQGIEDPQTSAETLGGLALKLIVGGALMSGGVMPATEAVTLELLAGTTRLADTNHEERIAA